MDAIHDPPAAPVTAPVSTGARWTGRVLTTLATLFLLMDAGMKIARAQVVLESFAQLGLPTGVAQPIGFVLLACLVLHLVPRTAALGAVLLTGFLGGAVAIHVRVGSPLLSHTLFPVHMGVLVWAGLFLRDTRVRALFTKAS